VELREIFSTGIGLVKKSVNPASGKRASFASDHEFSTNNRGFSTNQSVHSQRNQVRNVLAYETISTEIQSLFRRNPQGTESIQFFRDNEWAFRSKESSQSLLARFEFIERRHGGRELDGILGCNRRGSDFLEKGMVRIQGSELLHTLVKLLVGHEESSSVVIGVRGGTKLFY